MCLLQAAVLVRHIQIITCTEVTCLWLGGDMPSLSQLLAGLPLKNKKWIPLPCVKNFWPSWVQFSVTAGLERKRLMKPLHSEQLPAGSVEGEKVLSQEPCADTWRLEQPSLCVSETHRRTFLKPHARFWSHWVPLGMTHHLKANPLFLVFQASSETNLLSRFHPPPFTEAGGATLVWVKS